MIAYIYNEKQNTTKVQTNVPTVLALIQDCTSTGLTYLPHTDAIFKFFGHSESLYIAIEITAWERACVNWVNGGATIAPMMLQEVA